EAQRLAWDLTRWPPPDLVVFYDGVSDVNTAVLLSERGWGDLSSPIEPLTEEFLAQPGVQEAIDRSLRGGRVEPPPLPEGIEVVTTTVVPPMRPAEIGRLAARRYERSLQMSRNLASAYDLPTVWFWQPSRVSRPPVA